MQSFKEVEMLQKSQWQLSCHQSWYKVILIFLQCTCIYLLFTGSQMCIRHYYHGGLLDHRGAANRSHGITSGISISSGRFAVS